MKEILYRILSAWAGATRSSAEIGQTFLATLDALSKVDPSLTNWRFFDPQDEEGPGLPLDAQLRSSFTQFVEANTKQDDWDRPDPDYGYYLLASNHGVTESRNRVAEFSVTAGCRWENYSEFDIGGSSTPPDPLAITYRLYKHALLAIIAHWPAPWACAICSSWGERPAQASGDPSFPYSQYQMPWIGYLNAERARGLAVPAVLQSERTPDGGLLMSAATERLDPANREHMARSKVLAEIMIPRGGRPAR